MTMRTLLGSVLFALVLGLNACALRYGEPLASRTAAAAVPWLDRAAYPFESHFLQTDDGAVHYVDEGEPDNPTVVLVHGTPTWSFLYRHMIADLKEDHRVIALDHLGFGLSDKPDVHRTRMPLYGIGTDLFS